MKTYEEMAKNALTRGKAAREQRSKRNRIILSGVAVCGIAILLVISLVGNQGGPFSKIYKTEAGITGEGFQYIVGEQSPNNGSNAAVAAPDAKFRHGYIHIVARATEEMGVYEGLRYYGATRAFSYRLFRMKVIDPLQSGMVGEFYYILPKDLQCDLTQYDALLISMKQLPKNFVLRKGNELTAFEYLFTDPLRNPSLGTIIAFTRGVFDESLWQNEFWSLDYRYAKVKLDRKDEDLLVHRGTTLREALRRRQEQIDQLGEKAKPVTVMEYNFQSEAAQQAMAYMKPFENGVFAPNDIYWPYEYSVYRYINGCPTNEWVIINMEDERVITSGYRFEDADLENLPNISSYIANLDLTQFAPQHTDLDGKRLSYNSATGWYEKTENGVYSIVRIWWEYFDEDDYHTAYYDETFILLDETGDRIISREDLIDLIGENPNIYHGEYGVDEYVSICF